MEKAKIAGKKPVVIEVPAGKHAFCTCGHSTDQPFCNGNHSDTSFKPLVFELAEAKTCALCMCKQSKNLPYCDGTHTSLA